MRIRRLDNNVLKLIPQFLRMHTLDNLQLELTTNQPVRSDKDQQGN